MCVTSGHKYWDIITIFILKVKHGGVSVMVWACMAANGTGSLVFIDDVTADKSSRMNSEVFRAILSAHIQPNASELTGPYKLIRDCDRCGHFQTHPSFTGS